jgi:protein SCO1/2
MSEQVLRGRRRLRWEWLAVAVVAAVILGVVAFATFQPIKVLPRIRLAPGFLLTDQAGQRLTNEDLRGKIALYNFGYANCGAQCEPLNATMRAVQDQLAQAAGDPARMKNIIGGGFEAYYEPDDQGGFKFSPAFALVDGWGIIRAEYRNEVPTPERVLKHIEVIQEEARNSRGVAKMGYEAAHLFLCYAR